MNECRFLHLTNKGITFDPQTGDSFQINHTAEKILKLIQEKHNQDEIVDIMVKDYLIPHEKALTDYLEFTIQLKILGILR